jgi:hypothetical protein
MKDLKNNMEKKKAIRGGHFFVMMVGAQDIEMPRMRMHLTHLWNILVLDV